jgi:hypothetical protein
VSVTPGFHRSFGSGTTASWYYLLLFSIEPTL